MKQIFSNIKGDAFGGITAGIIALPLALAFGVSSGLGPAAGLYGAIFISFFAALFGGTNTQISGPTAPMTAVSMVVIASIIAANNGNITQALPIILTVFLLAGLLQIGLGFMGLGKYIKYIPYPVVSGFMTAIGVIILVTQILPSIGYYSKEDSEYVDRFKPQVEQVIFDRSINEIKTKKQNDALNLNDYNSVVSRVGEIDDLDVLSESKILAAREASGVWGTLKILPRALQNINWLELLLALGTIIIIYGFKKITKAVPSTLVALIVMSSIAVLCNFDYKQIEEIPSGLPIPNLEIFTGFQLKNITPYIFTALTLALLGAIDSLLTSVVADNMTKTKHKPNKELIGQGIGNSIASVFGGIPGAGATIRTVINISSGGKTKLSGMIASLLLLVILLGLGPIASKIPAAVLSGILITVGIGVMDYKGLKAIPSLPKDISVGPIKLSSEVLIMFVVLILSTFWNLVYAVGIGLVLASLIFMKKAGDMLGKKSTVKQLKETPWEDELSFPNNLKEEVFIKHINGPLFFGSTGDFLQLKSQLPESAKTVILRLDKMEYMDQSGLYAMEDMLYDLTKNEEQILFVGLQEQPRYMMERIDIIPDLVPEKQIFDTFNQCMEWVKQNIKNN
ncbi:sodium-independent anion transporter [Algibacter marinivivus]|uniref:Sodium-independent anion transporter n=1 Tax=Algibacter marinivivus TaxID=2100723 RepID=A0A2U2X8F4_9FLAO|nr:SulP family inorganic anion transporter [Algibacter marinivivus]PWH84068.1 sodium-independent anion transporter [Algibacter marinivivus]